MQKQNIRTTMIGIMVTLVVPFVLVGCSKHTSEAPPGGYPGGQKPGAVSNPTTDPGYAERPTRNGKAGAPSTPGVPGAGGQ